MTGLADLEGSAFLGYASHYVDRGERMGDDLFHLGFEQGGSVEAGDLGDLELTAGIWQGSFSGGKELNLYAELYKDLDVLGLVFGMTHSSFFGIGPLSSNEFEPYLWAGKEFSDMSLGVGAYFGASDSLPHGVYWEVTADYEMRLGTTTVELAATYGYFDTGEDHVSLAAALQIPLSENTSVVPHLACSRSEVIGGHLFGGVSILYSF